MDSFDEFGDCVNGFLPWNTVSDFACDEESAENLTREEFLTATGVTESDIEGDTLFYKMDFVLVSYNDDTDVHSFFVK